MFSNCSSLSSLPDISKWNTNNVIEIYYIFDGCSNTIFSKFIKKNLLMLFIKSKNFWLLYFQFDCFYLIK